MRQLFSDNIYHHLISVSLREPQDSAYVILLIWEDGEARKRRRRFSLLGIGLSLRAKAVEIPWRSTPLWSGDSTGWRPHSREKRCAKEKSAFATRKSRVSLGSLKSGMSGMVDISCLGLSVIFFSFPSCLANKALCQGQSVPCTSKYSILQLPYGI